MKDANNWSDMQIDHIWLNIHKKALTSIPENKKLIIQKYIHNQLPCNFKNNMMYEYKPPFCTLCKDTIEDQCHVLRCPNCPTRSMIRQKLKKSLRALLINTNTDDTVTRVISSTINAWLEMKTLPTIKDLARRLYQQ